MVCAALPATFTLLKAKVAGSAAHRANKTCRESREDLFVAQCFCVVLYAVEEKPLRRGCGAGSATVAGCHNAG